MKTEQKINLFLVDDDAVFLKLLQIEFLQFQNFNVQTFATGELCMAGMVTQPDVIILDYHLDGVDKTAMNGIQTLDKIKAVNKEIPVIMLSSQDKIEVAVDCMHHQAFDYVIKSETAFLRLQKIITRVIEHKKTESQLKWYMERM